MKRTGPLRRKTPLARKTRLSPMSDKRRDMYEREGGRRDVVARLLASRPTCEARRKIGAVLLFGDAEPIDARWMSTAACPAWSGCTVAPVDVHEIITRARGGSIIDETNLVAVCRACHRWIHENPRLAAHVGLLASANKGDDR